MRRQSKIFMATMILALVAAGTVREDEERPTDPYTGEVITWDINGNGEEEGAGLPENQGNGQTPEANIQEEFDALLQIYRNESEWETDGRVLTSCHISIPDYETYDWNQSNVRVLLRGKGETIVITLYKQSGFEAVEQIKTGRYAFVSAQTVDGSMSFRPEEPWIEVTDVDENSITLYPAKANISASDISISAELETVPDRVLNNEKTDEQKAFGVILKVISVAVAGFVLAAVVAVGILLNRWRKNRFS